MPLLAMIMHPIPGVVFYLARHWACAIDVVELVATLGGSGSSGRGGVRAPDEDQPWPRAAYALSDDFSEQQMHRAQLQLEGD